MEDWQNRVVYEKEQLSKRLDKIGQLLKSDEFNDLDMEDRWDLQDQAVAMSLYNSSLRRRIARF